MANNRYTYEVQRVQQQRTAQIVAQGFANYNQSLAESAQRQQEILLNAQNNLSHVFDRNTTRTTGTIMPNGAGGYTYQETTQ